MSTYYNDNNAFCCAVLRKNVQAGLLPAGRVDERDMREVHATDLLQYQHIHLFAGIGAFPLGFLRAGVPSACRLITGGFPCQDVSAAGKRKGITGERSGLWREMYRILEEFNELGIPFEYVVIENVRNLLSGKDEETYETAGTLTGGTMDDPAGETVFSTWMGVVLADLAQAGYDAEWHVLAASDFGAPHIRERVFIVAYPNNERQPSVRNGLPTRKDGTTFPSGAAPLADAGCSQWRQAPEERRDVSNRQNVRWQETTGRSGLCGQVMADAAEQRLPLRGGVGNTPYGTQTGTGLDSQLERCGEMADPDRQSLAVGVGGNAARGPCSAIARSGTGTIEPGMGRVFDGLSYRLDGYRWPARPGEQQYAWEPPRVVTQKVPHRVGRLKALGNALVVAAAECIGRGIRANWERREVAG